MTELYNPQILSQAAEWLLDLEEDANNPFLMAAFEAWIEEAAEHAEAFNLMREKLRLPEINFACRAIQAQQSDSGHFNVVHIAQPINRGPQRSTTLWARVAAVAMVVGVSASLLLWQPLNHSQTQLASSDLPSQAYSTRVGELKAQELEDGTHIDLNGNSQLLVQQTSTLRRVVLTHGEVYFDVAHDTNRPFVIETKLAQIRVLGTAFDVDQREDGVTVTVDRGHVRVGHNPVYDLYADQRLTLYRNSTVVREEVSPDNRQDWRSGWLDVHQVPLTEILEQLQRHSDKQLIAEPRLAQSLQISGRFNLRSPEHTLALISELHPIHITSTERTIYLSHP